MSKDRTRENISALFTDEQSIQSYLHPKKSTKVRLLKRAFTPLFSEKKNLVLYLINAIVGGLMPVLGAFAIQWLVREITKLSERGTTTLKEGGSLLFYVGIYTVSFFFLFAVKSLLNANMSAKQMYVRLEEMRKTFEKSASMDYALTENAAVQNAFGRYLNVINNSGSGLEGIYRRVFEESGYFVSFLIFSVILGRIHILIPVLGVLAIFFAAVGENLYNRYYFSVRPEEEKLGRRMYRIHREAQDFSYGKDIRVFGMGAVFQNLCEGIFREEKRILGKLQKKKALCHIPKAISFAVCEIGILFIVAASFQKGEIKLPEFVMMLSVSSIFVMQIVGIGRLLSYLYTESVDLQYYFDFVDAKLLSEGGKDMKMEEFNDFTLRLEDVWFRYPNSDAWVLQGVNLELKKGETLALVGVNGAGKTTLTNLINGLFMPTKGRITIGGINLNDLSRETLNRLIAVVFQDFEPIAVTVKENVACVTGESGRIDEERVKDCLKRAGIYEKIMSFEKGIDTMMLRVLEDEGMVLSGGENQKLAIARALYKKGTGLMIMDEPTSALDALAEEKIYRDFKSIMNGNSGLFISHRLASTRFCDKIVLLDGGRIKESGTHEELLERGGLYKEMFDTQASYYKEGTDET